MTHDEALRAVAALAHSMAADRDPAAAAPRLLDQPALERPWGWVFFLDVPARPDSEATASAPPRRVPVLVERHSGRLLLAGAPRPLDELLAAYEQTGNPNAPPNSRAPTTLSVRGSRRVLYTQGLVRELQFSAGHPAHAAAALAERCLRGETLTLVPGPGISPEGLRIRLQSLGLEVQLHAPGPAAAQAPAGSAT